MRALGGGGEDAVVIDLGEVEAGELRVGEGGGEEGGGGGGAEVAAGGHGVGLGGKGSTGQR